MLKRLFHITLLLLATVAAHADVELAGYEYWIDSDYSKRTVSKTSQQSISFDIDLSGQEDGIHILNFRAWDTEGTWGSLKRMLYFIPEASSPNITLKGYEYWMDNDVNSRIHKESSNTEQAFSIDISEMTPGVHFFNFRAYNSEGDMGALKRFLCYLPENANPDATVSRYEYWIDEDLSQKVAQETTGGDFVASVDISMLTAGVHYYNFRAQNNEGVWGALKRMLFYIPDNANPEATVQKCEYWLDDDYANKVSLPTSGGDFTRAIDISEMEQGVHFLNFRAQNSDGVWGALKRMLFCIPESTGGTAALEGYEYWIDNDVEHAVRRTSSQTAQTFSVDISDIEPGVHFLSYRAKNTEGTWGALKRLVFYASDGSESTGTPLVAYLYRFNSTTTEVPITPCQSYSMNEEVFEIPDAEEFLKLDPTDSSCKFAFPNGSSNGVTMTQTSKVSFSIQFKNERNVLSAPVSADFELSNTVTHDLFTLKTQGSLTFQKVSGGDFYAFKFEAENLNSNPLYLKADQACTIAFFDSMGNLLYRPYTSTELLATASLQNLAAKGTIYGVVYEMVKDADNAADNITIRLMTTNNIVPTPTMVYENGAISISCLQEGAKIYYTTDGMEPTTESTLYTAPIPVDHNMTVKAIATFDEMQPSDMASLTVDDFTVDAPVIQFANLLVYISCSTPESTIYYTLDGSDPASGSGVLYTGPVSVTQNCTVKAVGKRKDFNNSPVTVFELDVNNVKVTTPEMVVAGNTITVTTLTNDVQLYYTLDGSEPTILSSRYDGNITLEHNCTVKVKGFKNGYIDSETATLVVDWFYAEKPIMTINDDETMLTITCSTPGAVIYYEIGGAIPSEKSQVYSSPLVLTDNRVVKAFAKAPYFNDSEVAVFQPGRHTCDPATVTSNGLLAVLKTTTVDGRIYYTTNGSTPTENSDYVVNEGTVKLNSSSWYIKTMVAKENINNSVVTTYEVPAYYDRSTMTLYTHTEGHAAEGFVWNQGINMDKKIILSGMYNAADINFIRTKMPLMQHIDLTNAQIVGKSFADKAFADMDSLITIVIPVQINSVGNAIFENCPHLAAVRWLADINVPMPDVLLGKYEGHENLLLYVKSSSLVPAAYKNVVVNGVAENITLGDNAGDFYCPVAFTARKISYSHNYAQLSGYGECRGWESIALPFDVQAYTHSVRGKCAPFAAKQADAKPFWLYELSESGFVSASGIKANTPYIISMPNNDNYADSYILSGLVTFSSENVTVPSSEQTETRKSNGFTMYVNYGMPWLSKEYLFAMNVGEVYQGHAEGSLFARNLREVRPFEAYLSNIVIVQGVMTNTSEAHYFSLFGEEVALAIDEIPLKAGAMQVYIQNGRMYIDAAAPAKVKIYNVNGQLVRIVEINKGTTLVDDLYGGIYIVNGKKFAIK